MEFTKERNKKKAFSKLIRFYGKSHNFLKLETESIFLRYRRPISMSLDKNKNWLLKSIVCHDNVERPIMWSFQNEVTLMIKKVRVYKDAEFKERVSVDLSRDGIDDAIDGSRDGIVLAKKERFYYATPPSFRSKAKRRSPKFKCRTFRRNKKGIRDSKDFIDLQMHGPRIAGLNCTDEFF